MTAPVFNKVLTQPTFHSFPSSSESTITKLQIYTGKGLKELQIHFSSNDEVLKFCRENSFVADFAWLNFATFEGPEIARVKALLETYFVCEKTKEEFQNLTNQILVLYDI